MAQYARIEAGVVVEIISPTLPVNQLYTSEFCSTLVESDGVAGVAVGWTYTNGTFAPLVVIAPSAAQQLAQQAAALIAGGLAVTSTATAALNGTYAADTTTISYVNSELNSILLNGSFADGTATVEWPDGSGTLHAFDVAQFKTLAAALGAFVAGIRKCAIGVSGATLPPATVTIP